MNISELKVKYKAITKVSNIDYIPTDTMASVVKAYEQGRAEGYSKAENDYFAQSQKDREDTYNCGYAIGRQDAIDEIHTELITEIAMLNETDMTDTNLYTFAIRIKEITDRLISK